MKDYPFSFSATVLDCDCDPFGRLRASAALKYMQRAATEHLERLNLPYETLYRENIVFMLASVGLKFYRHPVSGEEIEVATSPREGRGAQMLREIIIFSADGEKLVEGQTSWVMINPLTEKLLRASDFKYTLPLSPLPYQPFCNAARIKFPTVDSPLGERPVRFSDIDRNMHMNNTVYADIISDAFGEKLLQGAQIDSLFIRYRAQARVGDMLTLCGGEESDKSLTLSAKIDSLLCFEGKMILKP